MLTASPRPRRALSTLSPRSVPARQYTLHEELGRGAMAVVHRAATPSGRIVALKQLRPFDDFEVDFDQVRSFVEEARLATRFRHPNIAETYALRKIDGRYVIEMEYVPGRTLLALTEHTAVTGPLAVAAVIQILLQLCDALDHVHSLCDDHGQPLHLVHRDVSLTNIIVSDAGTAKLIDFGIVKGHSAAAPTQAGLVKGKLAYVAPEYLAGQLDARADLFALGVVAHELLTGQRLFLGDTDRDTLNRLRSLRVPPPSRTRSNVSPKLDAIVLRALARDPAQRWQSARDMRDALLALARPDETLVARWLAWAATRTAQPAIADLDAVLASL